MSHPAHHARGGRTDTGAAPAASPGSPGHWGRRGPRPTSQGVDPDVTTAARIAPGHRLGIAICAYDTPHLVPTMSDLVNGLGEMGGDTPSALTVPTLR